MWREARAIFGCACVVLGGCSSVLGLDDFTNAGNAGGAGAATASSPGSGGSGNVGGDPGPGGAGGAAAPCGNGKLDPGETCDGDCPAECIDADLCTAETMEGAPDMCDAVCPFAKITACKSYDGCCPTGCFFGNDKDCDQKVVVVAYDPSNVMTIATALMGTGLFAQVDAFDTGTANPTLADLQAYSAVLVYTFASWKDPAQLGDVLADYFDAGGRVVLANGADCADQYRIRGRFEADGYHLLEEGGVEPNADQLGMLVEPQSPLLVGVSAVNASVHCVGAPVAGSTVVAELATTKAPVVLRAKVHNKNRVDVNLFPPSEYAQADVVRLLANALKYPL